MSDIIKVSASSLTTSVAGAIAGVIREQGRADVQAIGASAVNQAVKAIAIAHGYLQPDAIEIACLPRFVEVEIGGQERTALRFGVEGRRIEPAPSRASIHAPDVRSTSAPAGNLAERESA